MSDTAFERIACQVCGKPTGLSAEKCHEIIGRNNPLCRGHDACRIAEKNPEQFAYVEAGIDSNIFLSSCPGSGKTEVVGLKAAFEISQWEKPGVGLAVLSFTNDAAETITNRVLQFLGRDRLSYPHTVRTVDSWLQAYILQPFAHRITGYHGRDGDRSMTVVAEDDGSSWLNGFKGGIWYHFARNRALPILSHKVRHDPLTDNIHFFRPGTYGGLLSAKEYHNSKYLRAKHRDITLETLRTDLIDGKTNMWNKGVCTHYDVEAICYYLMTDEKVCNAVAARFPVIIIDECQDLSPLELAILNKLSAAGTVLHFIGDLEQAIYSFRDVFPEKIMQFINPRYQYKPDFVDSTAEWRGILGNILNDCCADENLADLSKNWISWAGIVRDTFPSLLVMHLMMPDGSSIDSFKFRAISNFGPTPVQHTLKNSDSTTDMIPTATIHKVKGETKSVIMLVSSSTGHSQGGHWKHWLDHSRENGEHARFAYVASSRPKWLLVWAVPTLTEDEKKTLKALGFTIEEQERTTEGAT